MKQIAKYLLFVTFIAIASYQLYWSSYSKNDFAYWEESRNIELVQKYEQGVFTLTDQAPLPIIAISMGKHIVKSAKNLENYRALTTLLSVLSIFIFAGIVFELTKNLLVTATIVTFPLLDTALQLQLRGAMADAFSVLGSLLCLYAFLKLLRLKNLNFLNITLVSTLWTLGFSIALLSKLNALYLILCWPLLFYFKKTERHLLTQNLVIQLLLALFLNIGTWSYYVSTQKQLGNDFGSLMSRPLSSAHENSLLMNEKLSLFDFSKQVYAHIAFYAYSYAGAGFDREAPVLGSDALFWPLASRPILYRWERVDLNHRYLYFIPNFWTWLMGLVAVLGSWVLWIRNGKEYLSKEPEVCALLILYSLALGFFALWNRVFYLYEYIPFLFMAWVLFALQIANLTKVAKFFNKAQILLSVLPFLVFWGYYQNRAFVNFYSQNCEALKQRYFLPFWGMKFQSCRDEEDQIKYNKSLENKK